MNTSGLRSFAALAGLAIATPLAPAQHGQTVFVGTTPCGDAARAFIEAGRNCPAIRWGLTLGTGEDANRWSLKAMYGTPLAVGMPDGIAVTKQGTLTRSTVQRLGA